MRRLRGVLVSGGAVALVAAASCGGSGADAHESSDDGRTLTVFAAASLHEAFEELGDSFEDAHPDVKVDLSFAGSTDLVAQIQGGAPADVFASADENTMATLTQEGLVADGPPIMATNTLTIVTAPDNPHRVRDLTDLAGPDADDLSVVTCAEQVPCGAATARVQDHAGVSITPVSEENSVTDVLGKVRSGQADAGLVYVTDAVAADGDVERVDFPQAAEVVNAYPVGVLEDTGDPELAQGFVDFVTSEQGQGVLAEAGFGPER